MSNLDRKTLLREFIREEPKNPFNYYALALEIKEKDSKEASELFDYLLENHPSYLPLYYPAAQFFFEQNQIQKANEIYAAGIQLAKNQNELKTLRELQNAYQNFLFETDLDED